LRLCFTWSPFCPEPGQSSIISTRYAASAVFYQLRTKLRQVVIVKKWMCIVCGLIYDEAQGWPDDGIAPGTRWEDVPADWMCPECGVGKEDFEMIEMD
jgi:rubredoxin